MMSETEFNTYLMDSYGNLEKKQEKLVHQYDLADYEEYWFDQKRGGRLQFLKDGKVVLEFEVVVVGSWSRQESAFLWGWANQSLTQKIRKNSKQLQGLFQKVGFEIFLHEAIAQAREDLCYQLTAMAVDYLDAAGFYRINSEQSDIFLAVLETASQEETLS